MVSTLWAQWRPPLPWQALLALVSCLGTLLVTGAALAHNVTEGDAGYVQEVTGSHPIAFIYLGAKHMVTGYDHLLFLAGVIFFLYQAKDIATCVSLFAIGHSVTMIAGVWWQIAINAYIIDAIIAFSVVYKALDNLGAFRLWFGVQPDTKAATLIFGLLHGFGLATKIQDYDISPDGLLGNLIAFNVGVEIGQLMALALILLAMRQWRARPAFARQAYAANVLMMVAGFALMGLQITGYFVA
ncbi:HupE/UreJ family protein [Tabrizicola sp.]|uniref:HupE/UreJ family protein n=1 Tax=Tabrizicola sp. TaxID=2005166 RepID=UPI002735DC4C|nr:HupE/UreJ family protein [Tabrizicola sp.]MDP3193925.1 HupE/UreJ family protein [Tabrizicola sp.]